MPAPTRTWWHRPSVASASTATPCCSRRSSDAESRATWANVVVHDHDHDPRSGSPSPGLGGPAQPHVPHRPLREILALLDEADLPERVRSRARSVFVRLGEVEGAIHGVDPDRGGTPRGRGARLDRRCRRRVRGTRSPRCRRGVVQPDRRRSRFGPQRPWGDPESSTRHGGAARRRRRVDRRDRHDAGSVDPDRCRVDDHARLRVRSDAIDDHLGPSATAPALPTHPSAPTSSRSSSATRPPQPATTARPSHSSKRTSTT